MEVEGEELEQGEEVVGLLLTVIRVSLTDQLLHPAKKSVVNEQNLRINSYLYPDIRYCTLH
jgi:hypothetical protein